MHTLSPAPLADSLALSKRNDSKEALQRHGQARTRCPSDRVLLQLAIRTPLPSPAVSRRSSLRTPPSSPRLGRSSQAPPPSPATSASEYDDDDDDEVQPQPPATRPTSLPPYASSPQLCRSQDDSARHIHPVSSFVQNKAWRPQALRQSTISRSASQRSMVLRPKPSLTLNRISSLDTFIQYREDKADWRRESLNVQSMVLESPDQDHCAGGRGEQDLATTSECSSMTEVALEDHLGRRNDATAPSIKDMPIRAEDEIAQETSMPANKFRHISAEVGFCFTIAMTQFLAEYLITGFAIELPRMVARIGVEDGAGSMGSFWPASLLSLILSATLLIFARISDMYCGYPPFMFGVTWLFIWTSVAGFANSLTLLDIARAMQGLAIAAFIPSTFAMIGGIYSDGPRKNFVLGLYAGFAPLGFFGGFLAAGALPEDSPGWYFWIAAAISFITVITAYLTVPRDGADREAMDLKMDWLGSILITGGLILVAYALAVEPYAGELDSSRSGWTYPMVLGPLISGMFALGAAVYVEGWVATCPLLPFSFFKPRSVKAFSFACLCFYASYGVWLYESAKVFQSPFATGKENGVQGVTLALWYVPTALGGLALCVVGGALLHIVPILMLLLISAVAWIGAPLLLALCPLPMNYWAFVMPSMLCATAGIDLTFTISVVFLSAVQPLKHQGLAGAVSSILVNLAMSFSLSISEIVSIKAQSTITMPDAASHQWTSAALRRAHRGSQAALIYAAASAGLGLVVSILFVRISRSRVNTKPADEEQPKEKSSRPVSSEAPTLTGVF